MIRASQFSLFSAQVVVWLPDPSAFVQARFLSAVLGRYSNRYDGDIQAIALPSDIPPDVPRIVLPSRDGQWKLQAGPARLDSFWFRPQRAIDSNDIITQCVEVLATYLQATKTQAIRIGVVLQRACPTNNPQQVLIDRFCSLEAKTGPLRNSRTFELHNHKRYHLVSANVEVNSWVRCRTVSIGPEETSAVGVEQDVNTSQEQGPVYFDAERLVAFVRSAVSEADSIMELYFPEGD